MKVLAVNAPITHSNCLGINIPITHTAVTQKEFQRAPKYHTEGCSHSFADSPGARMLIFAAFEP